eukprot:6178614-Pleurochrysis_carterae.AAC.6
MEKMRIRGVYRRADGLHAPSLKIWRRFLCRTSSICNACVAIAASAWTPYESSLERRGDRKLWKLVLERDAHAAEYA